MLCSQSLSHHTVLLSNALSPSCSSVALVWKVHGSCAWLWAVNKVKKSVWKCDDVQDCIVLVSVIKAQWSNRADLISSERVVLTVKETPAQMFVFFPLLFILVNFFFFLNSDVKYWSRCFFCVFSVDNTRYFTMAHLAATCRFGGQPVLPEAEIIYSRLCVVFLGNFLAIPPERKYIHVQVDTTRVNLFF